MFPDRATLAATQKIKLDALLSALVPANQFYTAKFKQAGVPPAAASLEEFAAHFPFTTKDELAADQAARPLYGSNLTYALERYTRCHQTSGTLGIPLRWLDTAESWDWMLRHWELVFRAAKVVSRDRVFCAFSFGPFIGFWLAFEAAARMGCLVMPGGGLASGTRLRLILEHGITVLCATPTYALHLAEVAATEGVDLSQSKVRVLVVAGEPGGSLPSVRARLTIAWPGARVFDHHGMTETGPVTHECPSRPGVLHVMESGYLPEIVNPETGQAVAPGQVGELILTPLGRTGMPLLRYRTRDLVKADPEPVCACGRSELALVGGILGRSDDMVVVRGVNVYPSAVEEILRRCGGFGEYQVTVRQDQTMVELSIDAETESGVADPSGFAERLQKALHAALALRVPVRCVPPGTLPRSETKARRWIRA